MSVIGAELGQGGFGNAMFKYAFARAYAEKIGAQLQTTPWIGQKIFRLDEPPIDYTNLARVEGELFEIGSTQNCLFDSYCQHGRHLIYTRKQVREWFKPQQWVLELATAVPAWEVAAHLRWGDFVGHNGFIPIKMASYDRAAELRGIDPKKIRFVCVDNPIPLPSAAPKDCPSWLPDFLTLWKADILFRGPSTFSWWAAVLGEHSRIFSPDQRGIPHDGSMQDVPFVEGYHMPITAWWEGHSELHLKDE